MMKVRFRRLSSNPDLPLPQRATEHSAGYDVRSVEKCVTLEPGEIRLVPNSPGTIDPDYRGELGVIMQNLGTESVTLKRGERIAQLVFARFETPDTEETDELSETDRGRGGFGSTGSR